MVISRDWELGHSSVQEQESIKAITGQHCRISRACAWFRRSGFILATYTHT